MAAGESVGKGDGDSKSLCEDDGGDGASIVESKGEAAAEVLEARPEILEVA